VRRHWRVALAAGLLAVTDAAGARTPHAVVVWPGPRGGHSMACDTRRQLIRMYGGSADSFLWAWDGSCWQAFDGQGPGLRNAAGLATMSSGIASSCMEVAPRSTGRGIPGNGMEAAGRG
jgi:hypothetical protein